MSSAAPRTSAPLVAPPWPVLQAPVHWRHVDFISDLHLQAEEVATFDAWQNFMQTTPADAVFILGDLFEVWVGDDVTGDQRGTAPQSGQTHGFETKCAQVLNAASRRLDIFFMHGNRDFLLGPAFAGICGMTVLEDPTALDFSGQRWLLSHGDALCLDDLEYMQFRAQVRQPAWQKEFLAKPLAERRNIARGLRTQSEQRQRSGIVYTDIDSDAARRWLHQTQAATLIHGHTHRPAEHALGNGLKRIVLSDWDATATPARGEVLRLSATLPDPSARVNVQRLATTLAG